VIFRPELARQIRQGRKTQTRRPVKPGEPCRYREGKSYAVQPGRGQTATCRIHITSVRLETAGEIAFTDARAEGFTTTDDFKTYWVAIHDKAWLDHETRMLEDAENDDGVILDRELWLTRRSLDMFDQRHADKPVWVITFHLHHDEQIRLLALRSDELYVTNAAQALPGEPEAVDEHTQREITRRSGTVQRQWGSIEQAGRDRDRALLSREDQIVRLRRAARLRSVDASRELWALEKMLAHGTHENFVAKVQKTERKVFQIAA
jgi:uncharacterized protein YhfF